MRRSAKYTKVDATDPVAFAQCDRCGFWRNRTDLVFQNAWAGTHLYSTGDLVCADRCYDIPNEQLRTIILPPDPPPVINARVPNFAYEEQTVRIIQFGQFVQTNVEAAVTIGAGGGTSMLVDSSGDALVVEAPVEVPITGGGLFLPPWGAGPMMPRETQDRTARVLQYLTSS